MSISLRIEAKWVRQYQTTHLGMVNIPPTKMVMTGAGSMKLFYLTLIQK